MFTSRTSDLSEGVGFILKFDFSPNILGKGLTLCAKIQIPYDGDNSVKIGIVNTWESGEPVWDTWDYEDQTTSASITHNGYRFGLAMDYLRGEHPIPFGKEGEEDFYYCSTMYVDKITA